MNKGNGDIFEELRESLLEPDNHKNELTFKKVIIKAMISYIFPKLDDERIYNYIYPKVSNGIKKEKNHRLSKNSPESLYVIAEHAKSNPSTFNEEKKSHIISPHLEKYYNKYITGSFYTNFSKIPLKEFKLDYDTFRKGDMKIFEELGFFSIDEHESFREKYLFISSVGMRKCIKFFYELKIILNDIPQFNLRDWEEAEQEIDDSTTQSDELQIFPSHLQQMYPLYSHPQVIKKRSSRTPNLDPLFSSREIATPQNSRIERSDYSMGELHWILSSWETLSEYIKRGLVGPRAFADVIKINEDIKIHFPEFKALLEQEGIPKIVYEDADLNDIGFLISFLLYDRFLYHHKEEEPFREFYLKLGLNILNSEEFIQKLPSSPPALARFIESYLIKPHFFAPQIVKSNLKLAELSHFVKKIKDILNNSKSLAEYYKFFQLYYPYKSQFAEFFRELFDYETSLNLILDSNMKITLYFLYELRHLAPDLLNKIVKVKEVREFIKRCKDLEFIYGYFKLNKNFRELFIETIKEWNLEQEMERILDNLDVNDTDSVKQATYLKFILDIIKKYIPNSMGSLKRVFKSNFEIEEIPAFEDSTQFQKFIELLHLFSVYFPEEVNNLWTEPLCKSILQKFLENEHLFHFGFKNQIYGKSDTTFIELDNPTGVKSSDDDYFDLNARKCHWFYTNWKNYAYQILYYACQKEVGKYSQVLVLIDAFQNLKTAIDKEYELTSMENQTIIQEFENFLLKIFDGLGEENFFTSLKHLIWDLATKYSSIDLMVFFVGFKRFLGDSFIKILDFEKLKNYFYVKEYDRLIEYFYDLECLTEDILNSNSEEENKALIENLLIFQKVKSSITGEKMGFVLETPRLLKKIYEFFPGKIEEINQALITQNSLLNIPYYEIKICLEFFEKHSPSLIPKLLTDVFNVENLSKIFYLSHGGWFNLDIYEEWRYFYEKYKREDLEKFDSFFKKRVKYHSNQF